MTNRRPAKLFQDGTELLNTKIRVSQKRYHDSQWKHNKILETPHLSYSGDKCPDSPEVVSHYNKREAEGHNMFECPENFWELDFNKCHEDIGISLTPREGVTNRMGYEFELRRVILQAKHRLDKRWQQIYNQYVDENVFQDELGRFVKGQDPVEITEGATS